MFSTLCRKPHVLLRIAKEFGGGTDDAGGMDGSAVPCAVMQVGSVGPSLCHAQQRKPVQIDGAVCHPQRIKSGCDAARYTIQPRWLPPCNVCLGRASAGR